MSAVGCFEHGPVGAGIESDIPSAFVNQVVVVPADQNQILEFGFAMEGPVNNVMRLAEPWMCATAGERTATVA